jgi:type IV secretion system protein VirD4
MSAIINAIFSLLFQLLETLFKGIGDGVVTLVPSRRNEIYNADFLNPNKVLSSSNDGYMYGNKKMSQMEAFSHVLVCGSSGSGKTTAVLLPSLLSLDNASILVNDPSGELFTLTSGAKRAQGFNVIVLFYDKPEVSAHYNPLARCKTKSDIKQLCKILIESTLGKGNGNDSFWNSSAESLLSLFIRYILFHTPKEHHTLYNVLTLVQKFAGTPKEVDKLFVSAHNDELLEEYKAYVAYDQKVLLNIVATAKTALNLFADEKVIEITSSDNIDFKNLHYQKTVVYLRGNTHQAKYFAPLSSLFFEQLFAYFLSDLPTGEMIPIYYLLDEASSLHLPLLPLALANFRKYRNSLMVVVQTETQILDMFGIQTGRSVIANCYTKCYLPGQPLETARQLEILMGKFEFKNDDGVSKTKPLMTMDEIRIMKESILLVGNKPPIKLDLVPFYKQKNLLKLTQIPSVSLRKKSTSDDSIVKPILLLNEKN